MFAAVDFAQMRVWSNIWTPNGNISVDRGTISRKALNPGLILRVTNSTNPWSNFLLIPVKGGWCIRIFTFRHDNIFIKNQLIQ